MLSIFTKVIPYGAKALKFATKHRRTLMTVGSAVCAVGATVYAVKATSDAKDILEAEVEERAVFNEQHPDVEPVSLKLTKKEVVSLTWKCYIPVGILLLMGLTGIIGNSILDKKKFDATMALYTASEATLTGYKDIVKKEVGEEKNKEINQKVIDKLANEGITDSQKANKDKPVIRTKCGDQLMIDAWSGQRFTGDVNYIRSVVNDLNQNMLYSSWNDGVTLNEYYESIDLSDVQAGNFIGWDPTRLIELDFDSTFIDDKSWIVVSFKNWPQKLYSDYEVRS